MFATNKLVRRFPIVYALEVFLIDSFVSFYK